MFSSYRPEGEHRKSSCVDCQQKLSFSIFSLTLTMINHIAYVNIKTNNPITGYIFYN